MIMQFWEWSKRIFFIFFGFLCYHFSWKSTK